MAFIDIKRDLVQWKFLLLNIAKKPSCQGGDSYEFAKINGNKIYIKGAIISKIDNMMNDTSFKLAEQTILCNYKLISILLFFCPPPDIGSIHQWYSRVKISLINLTLKQKPMLGSLTTWLF